MPIYRPPSVQNEPYVKALQWTIFRTPEGDDHLCAYIANGHDGRVTSKIMDTNGRTLTTRSGRQYFLEGEPGTNHHAQYVWNIWCTGHGLKSVDCRDVSSEYLQKIEMSEWNL